LAGYQKQTVFLAAPPPPAALTHGEEQRQAKN
jgi:hypothetical protein